MIITIRMFLAFPKGGKMFNEIYWRFEEMQENLLIALLFSCKLHCIYNLLLYRVAENSSKNLMSVANLGVCFGPTLMRPEEETILAIMHIKFCNIVVEILIENYEKVCEGWLGVSLLNFPLW